jgi:glycosyltransferase involved in cell wall biosynthesis
MVATFYPPYHFGGDAIYIYRLSNALARLGHHVDVVHDSDAFYLTGGREPQTTFEHHPNVRVHTLRSRAKWLSPLLTHQTAQPWLKGELRRLLATNRHDVVHFHNMSLMGAGALRLGTGVKLYTLHEHWLICPMHVLWKFDREPCTKRSCLACTLHGRRPPQLWRYTGLLDRHLQHIDRFLSPSRFTRDKHLERFDLPVTVLPYFVPRSVDEETNAPAARGRPYFLFVGRLVKLKGLQTLIPVFREYAEADLLVVGSGDYEPELRSAARDLPNVKFLGSVPYDRLRPLYQHAVALIMPSVGYEVFGIVLIEAFSMKTPVLVRALGGMPEAVEQSDAGFIYRDNTELVEAMRALQSSPELRRTLGENGYTAYLKLWDEKAHLDRYFEIIDRERQERQTATSEAAE